MTPNNGGYSMPFPSANGGFIVVDGTPDVTVHVTDWSAQFNVRLGDTTTSAGGSSDFTACLFDNSWSVNLPLDSANNEVVAGITAGTKITLYLKVGETTTYHRLVGTSVENVSPSNRNDGDVHRLSISGRGGVLTKYGAAPA